MSTEMFVTSESPLYKHVVEFIHRVWGSKDYFPGPQPVSIEYKHFPILKDGDYVVCEKTDGERHMMIATTFEGKSKCLFVNRAFNVFEVKININKKMYDGTILDGDFREWHPHLCHLSAGTFPIEEERGQRRWTVFTRPSQDAWACRGDGCVFEAKPGRVAAGHNAGTGGRTDRVGSIPLIKANAILGQGVDGRRFKAAVCCTAVV